MRDVSLYHWAINQRVEIVNNFDTRPFSPQLRGESKEITVL